MEVVQLLLTGVLAAPGTPGRWGGWGGRGLAARAAGNSGLEGYGNQYWPVRSRILAWRTSLTEKPGRHSLQDRKELDTTEATLHA